ncbi:polysaccharide deacetylase family protein [Akkermansiaceae bacterium]|nr:polysaccharide deacetylase family protein [Akkermansiaceae bacterium]MDB4537002.1 polysaccharide deacetylase family protein [Akkermansiaceae bacterium]
MKRRKLLLLTSGAVISIPSCGSKKSKKTAKAAKPTPQKAPAPASAAKKQYRPPAYVDRGLKNPSVNLPSSFGGSTVTHRNGPSSQPYVAMTFDDGPHPQNTPRLLDMLRSRNIKATFYVIGGNVDRHPHIVRRIVSEGHEIGNHTYTHRKLTSLGASDVREEMSKTQAAIVRAAGVKPRTMRPPYGALRTDQGNTIFSEFGYPTIMWSVDPQDWKRPGPSVVASRILSNSRNGSIILAHDLHKPTVDAMPQTFDGLLGRGFKFITVSQMLALKGQA